MIFSFTWNRSKRLTFCLYFPSDGFCAKKKQMKVVYFDISLRELNYHLLMKEILFL